MIEQTLSYNFAFDPITIRRKEVPQKAVSKKPALFHTNFFDPNLTHYFLQNGRYLLKYTSNRKTVFTIRQGKPLATTLPLTPSRSELRKCLKKLFQKSQHFSIQKILSQILTFFEIFLH
jgi:hypothetical protein